MRKSFLLLAIALYSISISAQEKPTLVVGIVVDQMRMDYIYRYWEKFSENGFKRMIRDGFLCKNAHINYAGTYTAPGHASIYSGSTPMTHGIIGNDWFDKKENQMVYCVYDSTQTSVGTKADAGKMSPHRMLVPTIGDVIRTNSVFKGKSIGISLKDRGAILPAGFSANGAYWMDYTSGDMVTSSYYMEKLPVWVSNFNKQKWPDKLAKNGWSTLLAIEKYVESSEDNSPYERLMDTKETPTFPYDLPAIIKASSYYSFGISPFGNTLLGKFAEQAIINEDLGGDENMDLLAISFSSTDMAGHMFGPQSIEIQDTYLRLDLELSSLLKMLDDRVGSGNYTLFLTADHAAPSVPQLLIDQGIPSGTVDRKDLRAYMEKALDTSFGDADWVRSYYNQELFFNYKTFDAQGKSIEDGYSVIRKALDDYDGIVSVYSKEDLQHPLPHNKFTQLTRNGWNQMRSGDMAVQYSPGLIEYYNKGTDHESSYNYDTHIPLILMGKGIKNGVSSDPVDVSQIVPTVCMAISVALPDASEHRVIKKALH